jgi:hypothetical protein
MSPKKRFLGSNNLILSYHNHGLAALLLALSMTKGRLALEEVPVILGDQSVPWSK